MSKLSFLGVPIKTDESMLDNKVKFVQPDGKEIVLDLKTGDTVIDLVAPDQEANTNSSNPPLLTKGDTE